MSFSKIAAVGLVAAMSLGTVGCDKPAKGDKNGETASAEAATNNTAAQTNNKDQAAADKAGDAKLPFRATGPVAKVGDTVITAEEYNEEVERMVEMMSFMPPSAMLGFKDKVLDNVIARHLVQGAIKDANVKVPQAEVDAEFTRIASRVKEKVPGGLQAFLAKQNMTEAKFKDAMKESLELKKLLSKDYDIEVAEADIKAEYEKNKQMFAQPEQVKASHILLKVEKDAPPAKDKEVKAKAAELAKKAKAKDADFAALAKEHSEGPTGPSGGDLGFFPKGKMVPEFDKAAYSMKVGEVSDPVKTQFGYHVIKVTDKKDAKTLTYAEVQPDLRDKLEQPKLRKAMTEWLEKRKAEVKVEKMLDNIKDNPDVAKQGGANPHGGMRMPPGMGGAPPQGGGAPPTPAPSGGSSPKLKLDKLK